MDRPLWMSGRDGQVFFDQLHLPVELQTYFGRPYVLVQELLDPASIFGAACVYFDGITKDALQCFIFDGLLLAEVVEVTPVNLTWAMGFGWSSYLAQAYMTSFCEEAGFLVSQFLHEEGDLPHQTQPAISVATDDVLHFCRRSQQEVSQMRDAPLLALD